MKTVRDFYGKIKSLRATRVKGDGVLGLKFKEFKKELIHELQKDGLKTDPKEIVDILNTLIYELSQMGMSQIDIKIFGFGLFSKKPINEKTWLWEDVKHKHKGTFKFYLDPKVRQFLIKHIDFEKTTEEMNKINSNLKKWYEVKEGVAKDEDKETKDTGK